MNKSFEIGCQNFSVTCQLEGMTGMTLKVSATPTFIEKIKQDYFLSDSLEKALTVLKRNGMESLTKDFVGGFEGACKRLFDDPLEDLLNPELKTEIFNMKVAVKDSKDYFGFAVTAMVMKIEKTIKTSEGLQIASLTYDFIGWFLRQEQRKIRKLEEARALAAKEIDAQAEKI